MLEIPDLQRVDVIFGDIKHMPKYETVPDEFKKGRGVFCDAISEWFFNGAQSATDGIKIGGITFKAKPGVPAGKALAAIKAVLSSFEPKHEHKEAACAFMLSEWFDVQKTTTTVG